jgi:taurine dioxygenase
VHQAFTRRITNFTKGESDAILAFLFEHSTRYEFAVRHHWTEGDIVFADNRVTQHAVVGDFGRAPRLVNRITLKGEKPIPAS